MAELESSPAEPSSLAAWPSAPGGGLRPRHPIDRQVSRLVGWLKVHFPPFGFWAGIVAIAYFWIAVSIDAYLNRSWWRFDNSSFSALGDAGANSTGAAAGLYWIYNDVVIFPTAILLMLFAAAMVSYSRNKIQSTGSAFFLVAGIFLFLVGVYHGETTETVNNAIIFCNPGCSGSPPYPSAYHDFVSDWFFYQADFSIFIWGFGVLAERRKRLTLGFLGLAILTPIFVALTVHPWHLSVAEVEAIAIIAIDLTAIMMFFARRPARREVSAKA